MKLPASHFDTDPIQRHFTTSPAALPPGKETLVPTG